MVLRGEDRFDWLQGQATNDIRKLSQAGQLSFCLCSATGQIEAIVDAWSLSDALWLTCDAAAAPAVRRRVEQMVILEEVTLSESDLGLVSIQGLTADEELGELIGVSLAGGSAMVTGSLDGESLLALRSDRCGSGGWDVWGSPSTLAAMAERFPLIDANSLEIARLEAGIPAFGREVTAKTLPPELGPAFESSHLSYQKGCYVGQEVLMRIFSRGHTNKTWRGLLLSSAVPPGAAVSSKGQIVGAVTSAAISPALGAIAGAMLREVAAVPGTRVQVTVGEDMVDAEVRAMPLI
jgi:folate-binding protein YgfZ